jgi:hypothetical protein
MAMTPSSGKRNTPKFGGKRRVPSQEGHHPPAGYLLGDSDTPKELPMSDYDDYDDQDACICESLGFDINDDNDPEGCNGWTDILNKE